MYCSRQVNDAGAVDEDGVHQIFKMVKSGSSWTPTQLTTGPETKFRPALPEGGGPLFFCRRDYPLYVGTRFNSIISRSSRAREQLVVASSSGRWRIRSRLRECCLHRSLESGRQGQREQRRDVEADLVRAQPADDGMAD